MSERAGIQEAADRLWAAQSNRRPCAPVRDLLEAGGLDAAYAVQAVNTGRRLAAGGRLVGRKIGLTSAAVQNQLGIDRPTWGMLFADMAMPDTPDLPIGALIQPKVEAEVAFVLGRDLDVEQPTAADVLRAVDFVVPALEIVDSRVESWNIRGLDTVADNASSGLYVLGNAPRSLTGLDLRRCAMALERGGEPVSNGTGAACLGHPVNALLWLARTLAKGDRPLKAGDTVLSGALGPMVAARPGDVFEAHIEGLGFVRAAFSAA